MALMTIHRIGKKPKAAPSSPADRVAPTGIEYAVSATTIETASEIRAAFHAARRSTPSRTNRVSSGSIATRAVMVSEPATESSSGLYMGHLVVRRVLADTGVGRVASGRGRPPGGASGRRGAEVGGSSSADRGVEHLDGVGEGHGGARPLERGVDLHEAPRVRRDEQVRTGATDVGRLEV